MILILWRSFSQVNLIWCRRFLASDTDLMEEVLAIETDLVEVVLASVTIMPKG